MGKTGLKLYVLIDDVGEVWISPRGTFCWTSRRGAEYWKKKGDRYGEGDFSIREADLILRSDLSTKVLKPSEAEALESFVTIA